MGDGAAHSLGQVGEEGRSVIDFLAFCRAHGLIVDSIVAGRWVRVPTTDHPRKRNGAYKFLGDVAFVQNHATQTEVAVWRADKGSDCKIDHRAIAEQAARADRKRREAQRRAADKAAEIVRQARVGPHAYLAAKGFEDEGGLVFSSDDGPALVVPMFIGRDLVGCQMIREDGSKKFLFGQATNDAAFVIGRGRPVYCEGYATALSVRDALSSARMAGSVVACFSAHNLARMARKLGNGWVVADNDESRTGERVAIETGLPYWISDRVGEDFNDYMQRAGRFQASQAIKGLLMAKARYVTGAPVP